MRRLIIPAILLMLLFLFPLQVFIIGDEMGIGIQGAVYRLQVTGFGDSFIILTQDLMYVVNGFYSWRTALSVIIWILGTIILSITTWYSIIQGYEKNPAYFNRVSIGLAGSCICFLISCMAQYGVFFHGPAGMSMPVGVIVVLIWLGLTRIYALDRVLGI